MYILCSLKKDFIICAWVCLQSPEEGARSSRARVRAVATLYVDLGVELWSSGRVTSYTESPLYYCNDTEWHEANFSLHCGLVSTVQ